MSIYLIRAVISVGLLAIASDAVGQQPQEIRLWPGKAPGSEKWIVPEGTTTSPTGDRTITNVSDPTVTVFLPAAANATGTAVVVAPGGALRLLGWDNEGVKVAQWLNSKGIAALVLKYRTLQTMLGSGRGRGAPPPGLTVARAGPRKELEIRNGNANPEPDDPALREVLHMGIADAQQALRLARRNAVAWRSDPARVGIIGFSAGGASPSGLPWQSDRTGRRISSCRSTGHRCRTSTCPRTRRRSSSRSVRPTST